MPELADGLSLESERQQVSRTFLCILASLNNAVVWIASTPPLISNSYNPLTKPLGTIPSAPVIIGITVTIMFHSFFNSLARFKYLSIFSFLIFFLWSAVKAKSTIWQVLFFVLTIFTNPSVRAGYDTSSIFKRSLTGLNSEFSFS